MRNQYFQVASQRNGPLNGTPIRGRSQNIKNFNTVRQANNKENGDFSRNISPNNLRKPGFNVMPAAQYSPRNQPNNIYQKYTQVTSRCVTHAMKRAQYHIQVEGDIYQYCETCAVHLVNQGFNALKIGQSNMGVSSGKKSLMLRQGSKKVLGYQPRQLPYYPQFQNNTNYHQILQFLKFLYSVQQNHYRNIQQFQNFQIKFQQQISATQEYYDNLLEIITQMKQDHLDDLYQQTQRYTQIAEIQIGHLRDNQIQIDSIREDIENNLQAIITKVDQQSFQNCVDYYRQRAHVYKVNAEQQEDTFKEVERLTNHDIKQKIDRVIEYLKDVWKQPDYQTKSMIKENISPTHFAMKVHEKLPSSNSQRKLNTKSNDTTQGQYIQIYHAETQKPACRSLFDAQESSQAVASPQFKNF